MNGARRVFITVRPGQGSTDLAIMIITHAVWEE